MAQNRFIALPRRSRNVLVALMEQQAAEDDSTDGAWLAALPRAIKAVWRERTDILSFLRSGDEELAYDLRQRFGLGAPLGKAHPIPIDLFDGSVEPPKTDPALIVLPIYNAAQVVERLLQHLSFRLEKMQRLVIVDDGSSDPRIAAMLQAFVARFPNATLARHDQNMGFVAAVNTGLGMRAAQEHAILLNSDALPPDNWVPRLLAPFQLDDTIASVTPLSNNAEILSVPAPGVEIAPNAEMVQTLDELACQLRYKRVALPTGIGFCLAMNRHFLNRIGAFDPAFGRGYGEEVDWCRKASAAGGQHVVAMNLFVGHDGGASFGAARKRSGIARASRRIAARYPDYPQEALDWERRDPIAPARLALALGWLGHVAAAPTRVYIAHSLGGGAETALEHEVKATLAAGAPAALILRVGGPMTWRLEVRGQRFSLTGDVASFRLLETLLDPIRRREVIYSCAVHGKDPAALPEAVLSLSQGHTLSMRLHDFYPISPSWNLLGSDGRFTGIPALDTTDPAHQLAPNRSRNGLSHQAWRAGWQRVIAAADEIVTFAASGAALLEQAYPEAQRKTVVRPHIPTMLPDRLRPGGQTIGVLGGINLAKGGAVLERLIRHTDRRVAIIGELDGRFRLPPPHIVHGVYDQRDIAKLALHYDVGVWLIPSVCPETFSFTTHEALATGLPVVCFDLGAQAEAAASAPNGHVVTCEIDDTSALAAALECLFSR